MEKLQLTVPDSLSEITLGQYQDYLKAIDGLNEQDHAEVINKKLIEAVCGIEYKYVDTIPMRDIESVLKVLTEAFSKEYDLQKKFKLLDVEMGFIPKLDDISLGEFIDAENTITDWQQIHKAMAVLYRPVNFSKGERYDIVPYQPSEEVQMLMKEMPLDVVMGCLVFFYRLGMELSTATLNSIQSLLKKAEKHTMSHLEAALEKNGVGINQFMHSLKEMSEDLTKLRSLNSTSVLPS